MKIKKVLAVTLAATLGATALAGCNSSTEESAVTNKAGETVVTSGDVTLKDYADVVLGTDYTDLSCTISMFNQRTDLDSEDYGGTTWEEYLAEFNKMYPNITVNITTDTNYAEDALTHLQSGDYETIMMIPAVDKSDLSTYFLSYGDLETMEGQINYADKWEYDDEVYGVPSTATTQGIVYNKAVFEEAGITEVPTTPEEFLADLQLIKDNTDAIPLYTNYAAGWTMGAWDAYISGNATGDVNYMNNVLIHSANPFSDFGDDTHPYAVYKILYDAVAQGLTEDDYTTTDWEGCKGMLNNGEIGCMVLGSWAYPQMEAAGDNASDVGYMPFPITVDGVQYASAGPDYCYGINANASVEEQAAAMVFVKWMTTESGFSYNEDGLPVVAGSTETKLDFDGVVLLQDAPAVEGEEDLLNELNSESELNLNNGGNDKIQAIIEHAANGDESFDDIMNEWNAAWSAAQDSCGVEVNQ